MQGVKKFVEKSNKNVRLSFLCKFFFDHFSRFPNFFVQMIIFFFVDYYNTTVCNVNNLKFDKFPFISNYYKPFFLFVKNKNTQNHKKTRMAFFYCEFYQFLILKLNFCIKNKILLLL